MKKWLVIGCTILSTLVLVSIAFAAGPIKLIVNGQEIKTDAPPQLINGRMMVPIRWVAQALGADVKWDAQNNAVIITKVSDISERVDNLVHIGDLPEEFRNMSSKFEGVEIPVYLPTWLPYNDTLSVVDFKGSKTGYSFTVVRTDSKTYSVADEVVTVAASQQSFLPYPIEEQLFSTTPEGSLALSDIQVQSYDAGMAIKWSKGNWEFTTIGNGPQDGVAIALEVIQSTSEKTSLVPGALQGKLRADQLGNPMYVAASWTYDGKTWYTLEGRSSVKDMVEMLQSVRQLKKDEPAGQKYYPQVPAEITTPEIALRAYFDALSVASNLQPDQMGATGGTVGMGLEPYPTAYGYWSQEWQDKHTYEEFLASWQGKANLELLKLLPAGTENGENRFFVEVKTIEAVGEPSRLGCFYYSGFFTVKKTSEGWRLNDGSLQSENLVWKIGGHQPWLGDPESVAHVQLGQSIDAPLGQPVTENNADGTVTVKYVDSSGNITHWATLVLREDGIWEVIEKQ